MIRLLFQNKLHHHGGVKVFLKSLSISQEFWRTSEIYWSIALCTKLRESINVLHEWIFIPNFFHIKARKFEARHFLFLYNFTFLSIFTSYSFHSKFQMFHSWIKNSWMQPQIPSVKVQYSSLKASLSTGRSFKQSYHPFTLICIW